MTNSHPLRVFLCHASQDKPVVRELYQRLLTENWIDPWLDEEKLLPGQDWDLEIEKAVEAADVVIVCLSGHSVSKEGYVQRELKFVLDIALEKPEGTIFVIPLRLDDCLVPRRPRSWQYVDYFPADHRKRTYQRLIQSLRARHSQLTASSHMAGEVQIFETPDPVAVAPKEMISAVVDLPRNQPVPSSATASPGLLDLVGSVLPILFFAQLVVVMFGEYDDIAWVLLGTTAIVYAFFLATRREFIANRWLGISLIAFLVVHGLVILGEYSGWPIADALKILDGFVALVVVVLQFVNFKSPRKPMPYSAILLATFLTLYGIKLLLNVLQQYPDWIQTPMIIVAMVGAVFLWLKR